LIFTEQIDIANNNKEAIRLRRMASLFLVLAIDLTNNQ
jgi:hypothetical protein